jgi:spore germination cell wall hydrolase CwlJ-like protein
MVVANGDLQTLALTLWGEARSEGRDGMIAVAWVIRNRVELDLNKDGKPDWWGEGYSQVCRAPYQFSCWNKADPNRPYLIGERPIPASQLLSCTQIAQWVMNNSVPDPTYGATHYYATSMRAAPPWAASAQKTTAIGRHIFFKDVR